MTISPERQAQIDAIVERQNARSLARSRSTLARKAAAGKLHRGVKAVLDAENPDWALGASERKWRAKYRQYAEFMAQHGRPPSRRSKDKVERALGWWLAEQRQLESAEKLPMDRVEALAAVPGHRWATALVPFEQRVREYAQFMADHGRPPSRRSKDKVERALGWWLAEQRRLESAEKLSMDRVEALAAVPGYESVGKKGPRRTHKDA